MTEDNIDNRMEEATASPAAPDLPDHLVNPNAVIVDEGVEWRYGKPPDYSKTRKEWARTKQMNHVAGSLPQLVENLVKNWEIEASFKPRLEDWRTIDHSNYSFAMNGGTPQSAEHMLKVGTYNAIICPNEYYSPEYSDFAASHKTFKRMMPTFAWEVLEVYSGPPVVAFKWRHWGEMKNDYVAFNDKGEKVTAKAHGGPIEIFGVTVAKVDDKVRLQAVDTWMDPLSMFRQIAPYGIVSKETTNRKIEGVETSAGLGDSNGHNEAHDNSHVTKVDIEDASTTILPQSVTCYFQQPSISDSIDSRVVFTFPFVAHSAADAGGVSLTQEVQDRVPSTSATLQSELSEATKLEQDRMTPTVSQSRPSSPITEEGAMECGTNDNRLTEELGHHGAQITVDQPESSEADVEAAAPETKKLKLSDDVDEKTQTVPMGTPHPLNTHGSHPPYVPRSMYSSDNNENPEIVPLLPVTDASSAPKSEVEAQELHAEESKLLAGVHLHPQDTEVAVMQDAGEAVTAPAESHEALETYGEMSNITPTEKEYLMNQE